jgi:hypothetical protein
MADSAIGGILMKPKKTGKTAGRESSWKILWVPCFLAFGCMAMTTCLCLVPLLAMVKLGQAIDRLFEVLLGGFLSEVLIGLLEILVWLAYALWLILAGEWGQLGWLLLTFLGGLFLLSLLGI